MTEVTDKFWYNEPFILIRPDRILEFFVTQDQSTDEKLNSIMRFGVYISIILAMYKKNVKYLTLSLLVGFITYFIYFNKAPEQSKEHLETDPYTNKDGYYRVNINNPFGNSSAIDRLDNPKRPPMDDYTSYTDNALKVKEKVNKAFNYNLYIAAEDLYGKSNSQRQFYTMPDKGQIPHDPDGQFKNWLYGSMPSCKSNTFDCAKRIHETPMMKRQIQYNPFTNPTKNT